MKSIAKKVQIIRLQEQICNCQRDGEKHCAKQYHAKRQCIKRDKNIMKKQTVKVRTTEEKWDERCKKAVQLFNEGMEYPDIAKKIGCNVSGLYRELKKRGRLQMPRSVTSSKLVKSPIISSQTKSRGSKGIKNIIGIGRRINVHMAIYYFSDKGFYQKNAKV